MGLSRCPQLMCKRPGLPTTRVQCKEEIGDSKNNGRGVFCRARSLIWRPHPVEHMAFGAGKLHIETLDLQFLPAAMISLLMQLSVIHRAPEG